jgi:hypothetical protein
MKMSANIVYVTGGNSGIDNNTLVNVDPIAMGTINVNVSNIRVVDAAVYQAKKVAKDGK